MTILSIFTYADQQVRTALVGGETWFVIADVASILGLSNPSMAASSLDADDLSSAEVIDSLGRKQTARTTNESGIYDLVFQSRKPGAKQFKKWVTGTVLPSIRKTGSYGSQLPSSFAEALELAAAKVREIESLESKIAEDAPKVSAWNELVSSAGTWSYLEVAHVLQGNKGIEIGQKRLVDSLVRWGLLYRDAKNRPHAYQSSIERGWFEEKFRTYTDMLTGERKQSSAPQVRITGKGIDEIYRRLSASHLVAVSS